LKKHANTGALESLHSVSEGVFSSEIEVGRIEAQAGQEDELNLGLGRDSHKLVERRVGSVECGITVGLGDAASLGDLLTESDMACVQETQRFKRHGRLLSAPC